MAHRFAERLATGPPLVADGGMGVLVSSAAPRMRCPEEANLRAPETVVKLHVGFIQAGADLIETNTFGANRRKLAANYLEDELQAINSSGVKLAREAREVAIEAVRSVSSLPILAMLTFDEGAETLAGLTAREAAERLGELGVAAAGANHGAGIQAALAALIEMAAIASAVKEEREPSAPLVFAEREVVVTVPERPAETELARMLRESEWVVSVQIDPPLGGSHEGMLEVARALKDSGGAGFVDINDNATARAGMSALMLSIAIERTVGIETIPHVTTRDATIMGLESQLLGAHAEGVRNVLAVTGDPPEVGDYPGSRGVYEIDSIGLTQLMARLNQGEDYNGRAIDAATSFFVGVAVNPSADDLETELERFRRKVEAGAHFAMTQIVFDLEYMDRFVERLGGEWPIPVLVGIFPVWSHQLALRLNNEVPGIVVPERVLEALRGAGPEAAEVGMELGRELLAGSRERADGAYVVAPFRRPLGILDLLEG